ncbi:MAG TPA: amidohydrolase family protein [Oscillospiraceae bacterium]|nr:amidohydrolase family protein [Oscillospiraceae bacterium]HPF56060.1 amidohydrolase family protein [Clostridiales bacterium]HPK36144.1 amidohydrolase family protein [Oscillospiraceae bacterium]HPR76715.1 amidohydrolase family protein [Oscillospiraceae bacterium]
MLLIKNANIVSMKSRAIDENQSVLIEDGMIQTIGNTSSVPESDCTVIDASGLYVMPGLVNMHTHLGDNPDDLTLYLANGVTAIRNMWGQEGFKPGQYLFGTRVFHHLRLKRQIEAGSAVGPDIFTAGAILDGDPPFFPKFMNIHAVKNAGQIRKIIKTQAEKGYDFIKIYSKLSLENFDDIMRIANEYGMPVAGHAPDAVGLKHALESKMRSVEHLYGFVNPYFPEKNLSDEQIREMAELAASNHVWNCPTLVANERLANVKMQEEYEKEESLAYVSEKNKKAMRFLIIEANKVYEKAGLTDQEAYMEKLFFIIRQLKAAGAGILLGTDKSVPYVVAGFSEHREIELLSRAGLSNYEILCAATVNAANCLGKAAEFGTVEAGKRADLVLTEKNPLDDLRTLSRHRGVFKRGVFYSRETCDKMLEEIKKRAAC